MSRRDDSCSRCACWRFLPHLNPFILDHPLHPPDSKVGFAGARLRKKRSFVDVLVRDIRTSLMVVVEAVTAAAVIVAQRGYQKGERSEKRGGRG